MDFDPTVPPAPLEPVPFNIPPAFRTTLPNGLRVVIFSDERLPLVSFRLAFLSGDAGDPSDLVGLTSAMTSLLTEGTENYTSRELAEKIERLGGSLHASSSEDFTVIAGSALTMYSSEMLRLMAEVAFAPTFPESELDLYKRNTIENLKFNRSQPNFLAGEQVGRQIFGDHPYGIAAPKPADVERLTREALINARNSIFIPNNAVLIAVGDVRKDELLMQIEDLFGDWQSAERHVQHLPQIPDRSRRTLTIVDRPGSAQSNIVLADLGIPRNHHDYFALLVMNQVLGAGASSRVFMNLREEKGYTYGAYTRLDARKLSGTFEATAEVRTAVTGDSLREFFYELGRIRDEAVPEQELADAKNFLTGVFPIRAETQEGLTNLIVNQELYGLPHDYLQTYREHVDAVTSADVQRVAEQYIRPDQLAIVIVGDGRELIGQVSEYCDGIEIFDKDGKELNMSEFEQDAGGAPADMAGEWKLALEFMGQEVPVTLVLTQHADSVSGTLSTMLGDGQLRDGKVTGSRFQASAVSEFQGSEVEFSISGTVRDNSIEGTISSALVPAPMNFTGTRAA